jgi:signal peptidase
MKTPLNSTIGYIILGVILAFAINQGMAFALSTDMPVVAVESNSMIPTFYKGDILILQGVPTEKLKIGDIVVFSPAGREIPIVHRIIEINSDGSFQTKGDANSGQMAFEKHVESSQIHGKSILIVPYVGWVKIGITEYIIPNIGWIVLAAVATYSALIVSKHIKRPGTTYMRMV